MFYVTYLKIIKLFVQMLCKDSFVACICCFSWCIPVLLWWECFVASQSSLDNKNCLWKVYLVLRHDTETNSIFWSLLLTTVSNLDFGNTQFLIKSVQPAAVTAWSETLGKWLIFTHTKKKKTFDLQKWLFCVWVFGCSSV